MQQTPSNPKNDTTKNKAPEAAEQEFHFSGGLEFWPITIKAKSREEAEELWLKQRKPVESAAALSTSETNQ